MSEDKTKSEPEAPPKPSGESDWKKTILAAIVAAAVAALGNSASSLLSSSEQLKLERFKAESARIVSAISGPDLGKSKDNLLFLVNSGLVQDPTILEKLPKYLSATETTHLPNFSGMAPQIKENQLSHEALTGLLAKGYLLGVDVLPLERKLDYARLKASGVKFVYLEFADLDSPGVQKFANEAEAARKEGLKVGLYHKFDPGSAQEPQLAAWKAVMDATKWSLPPTLDVCSGLTFQQTADASVAEAARSLAEALKHTYSGAIVYWCEKPNEALSSALSVFPLWVENYSRDFVAMNVGKWERPKFVSIGEGVYDDATLKDLNIDIFLGSSEDLARISRDGP